MALTEDPCGFDHEDSRDKPEVDHPHHDRETTEEDDCHPNECESADHGSNLFENSEPQGKGVELLVTLLRVGDPE